MPDKRVGHHGQKAVGNSTVKRDDLGQLVSVPWFCRKGCDTGWPSRRARAAHERGHVQSLRPNPLKREPEVGTANHYKWCKRNNLEIPQVDRDAVAAYMREWRGRTRRAK